MVRNELILLAWCSYLLLLRMFFAGLHLWNICVVPVGRVCTVICLWLVALLCCDCDGHWALLALVVVLFSLPILASVCVCVLPLSLFLPPSLSLSLPFPLPQPPTDSFWCACVCVCVCFLMCMAQKSLRQDNYQCVRVTHRSASCCIRYVYDTYSYNRLLWQLVLLACYLYFHKKLFPFCWLPCLQDCFYPQPWEDCMYFKPWDLTLASGLKKMSSKVTFFFHWTGWQTEISVCSKVIREHITRSSGLAKTILQGTVQGGRQRGRQRERWEDNSKEWTGLEWNIILRKVENR